MCWEADNGGGGEYLCVSVILSACGEKGTRGEGGGKEMEITHFCYYLLGSTFLFVSYIY